MLLTQVFRQTARHRFYAILRYVSSSLYVTDKYPSFVASSDRISLDEKLELGDFISSDTGHRVRAEIENILVVEKWRGYAKPGHANSGTLSFNPKTAKEPTITFNPESVDDEIGRPKVLSYIIKAKVSDIEEQTPINQNNLNQLRQEYVDLGMDRIPGISSFDQSSPNFAKLLDKPAILHQLCCTPICPA